MTSAAPKKRPPRMRLLKRVARLEALVKALTARVDQLDGGSNTPGSEGV